MTPEQIAMRNEIDRDVASYVREMSQQAMVTEDSVLAFLTGPRRRRILMHEVRDRLTYLVGAGYLAKQAEWIGGEVVHYTCTADGIDWLDGVAPPRGWSGKYQG